MAGKGSSAQQIVGDSHLCAPLGTPPAISPPLAAPPLADGHSSGRDTEAWMWVEIPCTLGLPARRASRAPRILSLQTRTLALRFISKSHVVTESWELAKPAVRVLVLLCPPQRRGPQPWLRTAPGVALGGTEQEAQVCQALGVIFFPPDSTKEGNEKRPLLWLRFTLEGCFLPAAPMLQHRKFASANTWCCFKQPDGPNLSLR